MKPSGSGVFATEKDRPREAFDDPARGEATWFTLFSGDITPTERLTAGVMHLEPGEELKPHRHAQAEIYYVAGGAGVVTIDGVETAVETGVAVFIPSDAEHSVRAEGEHTLKVLYVFPTNRFADVVYRFS
jgi:quercetin dioxygenase-like cupin family protein